MTLKTIQPSECHDQDGRIPVFRPTMAEFEDFYAFMEAIDHYGKQAGVVKVIPPKEWTLNLPSINEQLELARVRNPIIQHIIGCQGIYHQTNIEKRRPYTLNQWYSLCQQSDYKPPDLTTDRSSRPLPRKHGRSSQQNDIHRPPSANTRSQSKRTRKMASSTDTSHPTPNHRSPKVAKRTKWDIQADEIAQAQSNDPIPLTFDLHGHNEHLYTADYCKALERIYWRNLTFTQPIYGADISGTLFSDFVKSWNVNRLDNILNQLDVSLPGVNTPYLYFGMWKSTFPWHVEDLDLYSINYLHFGAPKQWYVIPGSYNKKFKSVMQTLFYQQSKECPEFLRHKTHIASPTLLANHGIPVHRCVQHQGEFMITFPFGYHSGYNLGFNCAESVNFALSSWLEIGRQAKPCQCISDSVTIDMTIFDSTNTATSLSPSPPPKKTNTLPIQLANDTACVLCTNQRPTDMKSDSGWMVHQLCAESIPETYLDSVNGQWIVRGLNNISPARWKLACLYCRQTKGVCAQCCFGRCWRSFHASCAKDAGATMERMIDQSHSNLVYDIYCPLHDPELLKKKKLENQQDATRILYPGKSVYIKWKDSGIYKGLVEGHLEQRKSSRIKFANGRSRIVAWKNIRLDS